MAPNSRPQGVLKDLAEFVQGGGIAAALGQPTFLETLTQAGNTARQVQNAGLPFAYQAQAMLEDPAALAIAGSLGPADIGGALGGTRALQLGRGGSVTQAPPTRFRYYGPKDYPSGQLDAEEINPYSTIDLPGIGQARETGSYGVPTFNYSFENQLVQGPLDRAKPFMYGPRAHPTFFRDSEEVAHDLALSYGKLARESGQDVPPAIVDENGARIQDILAGLGNRPGFVGGAQYSIGNGTLAHAGTTRKGEPLYEYSQGIWRRGEDVKLNGIDSLIAHESGHFWPMQVYGKLFPDEFMEEAMKNYSGSRGALWEDMIHNSVAARPNSWYSAYGDHVDDLIDAPGLLVDPNLPSPTPVNAKHAAYLKQPWELLADAHSTRFTVPQNLSEPLYDTMTAYLRRPEFRNIFDVRYAVPLALSGGLSALLAPEFDSQ